MDAYGINYLHAKFQINILKTKQLLNFQNSGNIGLKKGKRKIANTGVFYNTNKKRKEKNSEYKSVLQHL